jgi:hypothetical protein
VAKITFSAEYVRDGAPILAGWNGRRSKSNSCPRTGRRRSRRVRRGLPRFRRRGGGLEHGREWERSGLGGQFRSRGVRHDRQFGSGRVGQLGVSKTPIGSGALIGNVCGCGVPAGPCCRQGMCKAGFGDCSSPADTLPNCADAGGMCMPSILYSGCTQGPSGSCAYADEVCCVN